MASSKTIENLLNISLSEIGLPAHVNLSAIYLIFKQYSSMLSDFFSQSIHLISQLKNPTLIMLPKLFL